MKSYLDSVPPDLRSVAGEFSTDGMWSQPKEGRSCVTAGIFMGMPDGCARLVGWGDAYRSTGTSDRNAVRGGAGGDASANSHQLEHLATQSLVTFLLEHGISKGELPAAVVEGDVAVQDLLRERLGVKYVHSCDNHAARAIRKLFRAWEEKQENKGPRDRATLLPPSLRRAAVNRTDTTAKEARALLHSAVSAVAARHQSAAASAAAGASSSSASAAAGAGSSSAFAASSTAQAVEDDGDDEEELLGIDEEQAQADAAISSAAVSRLLARRAATREFEDDVTAAVAAAAAATNDFAPVRAVMDAARSQARSRASSQAQATDGAASVDDAPAPALGRGHRVRRARGYFETLALDSDLSLFNPDDDDGGGEETHSAAAVASSSGSGGIGSSSSSSSSGSGAGGVGAIASTNAAAPTRVYCSCKKTCTRKCPCKTGNIACCPGAGCNCSPSKCTNKHGLIDSTYNDRANAEQRQGRYLPYLPPAYFLDQMKKLREIRAASKASAATAASSSSSVPTRTSDGSQRAASSSSSSSSAAAAAAEFIVEAAEDEDDDADGNADDAGGDDDDEGPRRGRGASKRFAWLKKQCNIHKLPEAMSFADRLLNRRSTLMSDPDITTVAQFDEAMSESMSHWTSDHPRAHVHCSRGCYLRSAYPTVYTGSSPAAAASAAAVDEVDELAATSPDAGDVEEGPDGMQRAVGGSTDYRVVRDPDFIKFILGVIIVLSDRFKPGRKRRTTNHNEALHAMITGGGPSKIRFFLRFWQLWMMMQLLEYDSGPGLWRIKVYEALDIPIAVGTRHELLRQSAESAALRAYRRKPEVQKARARSKLANRDHVRLLNGPNIADYTKATQLKSELAELYPSLPANLTPHEAGVLAHLGMHVAKAELREEVLEQRRVAREEKKEQKAALAAAAAESRDDAEEEELPEEEEFE